MKTILLTGFDPVKGVGDTENPSIDLVNEFPDTFQGFRVVKLEIPTAFDRSRQMLSDAVMEYKPEIALSVGLSASRPNITLERVGINMRDAGEMDDNDGMRPIDEPIFADGDAAYFTNFPVRDILKQTANEGIPLFLSHFAGTYGCNQALYTLLYHSAKKVPGMLGGFLHVPYFPEMVATRSKLPSMAKSYSARALEICLEKAVSLRK